MIQQLSLGSMRRSAHLLMLLGLIGLTVPALGQTTSNPTLQTAPYSQNPSGQVPADAGPLAPAQGGLPELPAGKPEAPQPRYEGTVPFIQTINDPIEPFNRAMFAFNDMLIQGIINPLAKGYDVIAPEPVRKSIRKAGDNLAYPVRLVNTLLQGKGMGALSETGRFLINSTVGLLGFFDPATRIGLPAYKEDFGQTFGSWGYTPGFYFVLPFFGPSSGRDALGSIFDAAFNPATYIPGASTFFSFNRMTFTLPTYQQLRTVERDPYVLVRDVTALTRQKDTQDFVVNVKDIEPDPTLKSIYTRLRDKEFPKKMAEYHALIPGTGRKLPYSAWLQPYPSPLIFVMGGTGSHRMSEATMAMAEIFYRDRFSVVTISSAMNWEFMENGATAAVPGYPPTDASDLYRALDSIYQDIKRRFPGRFNDRGKALVGASLGGIHTLYVSSFAESMPQSFLHFDRYLAIDTPTDLIYALQNLDNYYNAPLEWRPEERKQRIENTLMKAVALSESENVSPEADLPFNRIESRYLIGLAFKLILRDVIYSSQKREDLGVLHGTFNRMSRDELYNDIVKYSFIEYMNVFVIPYYMNQPNFRIPREELLRNSSLRPIEDSIRRNDKIRAFINDNDFFLRPDDLNWYEKTLGKRLTVLSSGGHLGNLYLPDVQSKLVDAVQDIKSIGSNRE